MSHAAPIATNPNALAYSDGSGTTCSEPSTNRVKLNKRIGAFLKQHMK